MSAIEPTVTSDVTIGEEFAQRRQTRTKRGERRSLPRAKTLNITRANRATIAAARAAEADDGRRRLPLTRGDCIEDDRPCPYISCKFHLFLDVTKIGNIKINFPHLMDPDGTPRLDEMEFTCALDIADNGGETLDALGTRMNMTRERIRQIVKAIIKKLRGTPAFSEVARLFGLKLDGAKEDFEITDELLDSFGVAGKVPEEERQDEYEDEP